jgi:hypothetical protein
MLCRCHDLEVLGIVVEFISVYVVDPFCGKEIPSKPPLDY